MNLALEIGHTMPSMQVLFGRISVVRKPTHMVYNIVSPIYILGVLASLTFSYKGLWSLTIFGNFLLNENIDQKIANERGRLNLIISIQLSVLFLTHLIEDNASPSGDLPAPRINGFVRYVCLICLAAFVETVFILHFRNQGDLIFPDCILKFVRGRRIASMWGDREHTEVASDRIGRSLFIMKFIDRCCLVMGYAILVSFFHFS